MFILPNSLTNEEFLTTEFDLDGFDVINKADADWIEQELCEFYEERVLKAVPFADKDEVGDFVAELVSAHLEEFVEAIEALAKEALQELYTDQNAEREYQSMHAVGKI